MDGELPSADDEIAIDRMYADNNKLKVGDSLTVGGKKLKITGLVALSDYSALYSWYEKIRSKLQNSWVQMLRHLWQAV